MKARTRRTGLVAVLGAAALTAAAASQSSPRALGTAAAPRQVEWGAAPSCGQAIPGPRRQKAMMTIPGIQGGGPNGSIDVFEVSHSVLQPVDPGTGLPNGTIYRGEFSVTKTVGPSSPQLMQELVQGNALSHVDIDFFDGGGTLDYTIKLETARVIRFETRMVKRWDGSYAHLEEIDFSYQRITYSDHSAGYSFQDDRTVPPDH